MDSKVASVDGRGHGRFLFALLVVIGDDLRARARFDRSIPIAGLRVHVVVLRFEIGQDAFGQVVRPG